MPKKKVNQLQEVTPIEQVTPEQLFPALLKYFKEEGGDNVIDHYFLDSGNLGLNYIISGKLNGGYCSGMVTELFGLPSTGKTLLLMKAVANIQKEGGLAIVNDVERRWDWDFAKTHGVILEKVLKAHPETIEEFTIHTDKVLDEILAQDPIPKVLICLDSLASISTYWEMENVGTKEDQGKKAKRVKATMRVLPKKISKAGAILLVANHVISDPRITYGSDLITPGGKGVTFQASIRLEMYKPIMITPEGKNRPIGATLRLKCVKSSICPPFGEVDINTIWATGVDRYSGLIEIMVDLGIVKHAGGWFEYKDKKFRAKDLGQFCQENPEILIDECWTKPYFLGGE